MPGAAEAGATTAQDLAEALRAAAAAHRSITLYGNNTKQAMAGPIAQSDVVITTAGLRRVLAYEPRDLTVSVEAGLPWRDLTAMLAEHGQMLPLDPPFADGCTVGGVIAANVSGPRRRLYGSARDMVIGMTFATLEGKLVQTGGMVVKNVAGLDMGKLMIGSFGTLAAIASVNFRVYPIPPCSRTFVREFADVDGAIAARDALLASVLQPAAIDLVHEDAAWRLCVQASGNAAVVERWTREMQGWTALDGDEERALWRGIQEYTPAFLNGHPEGAVVRTSVKLSEIGHTLQSFPGRAIARAGTGVCYGYFERWQDAMGRGLIEFAPEEARRTAELWPHPGSDFEMMVRIKAMFDPGGLLNRGRLYSRI